MYVCMYTGKGNDLVNLALYIDYKISLEWS